VRMNHYLMTKTAMMTSRFLRRLDDKELDSWIRAQSSDSWSHSLGLREFHRRQEACHREHDLLAIRVSVFVTLILAGGAFGAVYASGALIR
jgi:hypothetical protein